MLSLNKSLHAIEAAEPDVVEVYRSAAPVAISPAGQAKQPCEAFLCSVTVDKAVHLYGALLLTRNKKVLVYTPPSQPRDKTAYAKSMEASLAHMESLGFTMQSVNLNFSRALREVVLNDIRVLRPPQLHKKHAASPVATAASPPEKTAGEKKPHGERATVEKREAQPHGAVKEGKKSAGDGKEPAKNPPARERSAEREEMERLAREHAEKERLLAEKRAAEETLAEERKVMEAEKARLTAAIGEKERLIAEREHALKTAGEGLSALQAEAERLTKDNAHKERLAAQSAAAEEKLSAEVGAVQAEIAQLAAAGAALDQVVAEKTAAEKSTALNLEALQAERERLVAEMAGKDRLAAEKEAAEKVLAGKLLAVKAEVKQLAAAQGRPGGATGAEPATGGAAVQPEVEQTATKKTADEKAEAEQAAMVQALTDGSATDPFAFMGSGNGGVEAPPLQQQGPATTFHVERFMECIEIAGPEAVIELHQSLNTSRIALEGFPTQNCSAYLCGVRTDVGVRVYIAMFLTENRKVLVYVPGKQPESKASYTKTVGDAMDFVEIVGFMMDPVKLGGTVEQRARAIAPIPVLRLVESGT